MVADSYENGSLICSESGTISEPSKTLLDLVEVLPLRSSFPGTFYAGRLGQPFSLQYPTSYAHYIITITIHALLPRTVYCPF